MHINYLVKGYNVNALQVTRQLVEDLTESLLGTATDDVVEMVQIHLRNQDWTTLTNVRDLWFELYDIVQPTTYRR